MVNKNLFSRYLLTPMHLPDWSPMAGSMRAHSCVDSIRVPREVGLHRVEQIEIVGVVSLVVASNPHHQHEIHEPMGGVAGRMQAVQGDAGQAAVDVTVRDPLPGS